MDKASFPKFYCISVESKIRKSCPFGSNKSHVKDVACWITKACDLNFEATI